MNKEKEEQSLTIEERLAILEKAVMKPKEILTFEEACEFLQLSKSTVYKMTHTRSIPFYKPGGRYIYFERSELEKWIRSSPVRTEEELDDEANKYIMDHQYSLMAP